MLYTLNTNKNYSYIICSFRKTKAWAHSMVALAPLPLFFHFVYPPDVYSDSHHVLETAFIQVTSL